jgi:transcriptional regulator of acetoin/glycerol metabolism
VLAAVKERSLEVEHELLDDGMVALAPVRLDTSPQDVRAQMRTVRALDMRIRHLSSVSEALVRDGGIDADELLALLDNMEATATAEKDAARVYAELLGFELTPKRSIYVRGTGNVGEYVQTCECSGHMALHSLRTACYDCPYSRLRTHAARGGVRASIDKETLQALLEAHNYNVTAVTRVTPYARSTVYEAIKRHGIELPRTKVRRTACSYG